MAENPMWSFKQRPGHAGSNPSLPGLPLILLLGTALLVLSSCGPLSKSTAENQQASSHDGVPIRPENAAGRKPGGGRNPCGEDKLRQVRAKASKDGARTVAIDCDLVLKSNDVITKRLVLQGKAATGVTVDCNGAKLDGGKGTVNHNREMIEIRSRSYVKNKVRKWQQIKDVTIRNCNIVGVVRIWGMAKTGEGREYKEKGKATATNYYKISSRKPGHTARARANAPTNVTLENVTITGTGFIPLYFAPGVTHSRLIDSEMNGISGKVAIYLDAESAWNTIKGNKIHVETVASPDLRILNAFQFPPGTPIIAVDGSSRNTITGNEFSLLEHGGIYLYRNCGEGGVIRHATPSHNRITNNIFLYGNYKGPNPAVYLGSRDGSGWFPVFNNIPCHRDEGYLDAGSAKSNEDEARHNIVTHNQFHTDLKGVSLDDMIKSKDWEDNSANIIGDNELVIGKPAD